MLLAQNTLTMYMNMENRMNRKYFVLILMFIMEMPISREQEEGQGRSNPPCRVTNQQTSEIFARIILFSRFINEMSLPWFLLSWLGSFPFKIWLFYPQISFSYFSCRRDLSCLRSLVTEGSLNTNPSSRLLYSSGRCQQPLDEQSISGDIFSKVASASSNQPHIVRSSGTN